MIPGFSLLTSFLSFCFKDPEISHPLNRHLNFSMSKTKLTFPTPNPLPLFTLNLLLAPPSSKPGILRCAHLRNDQILIHVLNNSPTCLLSILTATALVLAQIPSSTDSAIVTSLPASTHSSNPMGNLLPTSSENLIMSLPCLKLFTSSHCSVRHNYSLPHSKYLLFTEAYAKYEECLKWLLPFKEFTIYLRRQTYK